MNFSKNRLREVDQRAMLIGKMVSLLILPFGNPKSARGGHPYLRKLFPFVSSKIFKRKSNVKQILVELSKLNPWLCLSLFEFCAYFVVFLFSVQLKKILFRF